MCKGTKKKRLPNPWRIFKRDANRASHLTLSVSHAESNGVQWIFGIVW